MIERDYVVVQEGAELLEASSEWREATLGQLGRIITGKTPSSRNPRYFGGAIPFVTPSDFNGPRRIESTERNLTEQGLNAVKGARIPSNSIMVSCIGSDMGKAAITVKSCVTNQQINSIVVNSDTDALFVYYNLSNRKDEIRGFAGGSAQPILNKSGFGQLSILLPPLPEQRAIAHVLGALDDKIELNRWMNETLEEMARALFKSWFVDFDPVRAKMEGRWRRGESLPGLPADLYDLFPNRLVDSELGEVPEGWGVGTVSQLAERIQNGGTPKRSEPIYWNPGEVPWLTSAEVRQSFVLEPENFISQVGLARSSAKVIPARSILVALYGATAGQVSMNFHPLSTNQAISAIIPTDGNRFFCLLALKSQVAELGNRAVGSAQQNISKKAVESTTLVLPSIELRSNYNDLLEGMFDRILHNLEESRTLIAKRDALLPKLVSGEVGVMAENSMEETK